jgi:hypothetical protein
MAQYTRPAAPDPLPSDGSVLEQKQLLRRFAINVGVKRPDQVRCERTM